MSGGGQIDPASVVVFLSVNDNQLANINQHCWEENLKIRKLAKFELKVLGPKWTKTLAREVTKFYRRLYSWGTTLPFTIQIPQFCRTLSFSFQEITSKGNFTLILRNSFQRWWQMFAIRSQLKVKKKNWKGLLYIMYSPLLYSAFIPLMWLFHYRMSKILQNLSVFFTYYWIFIYI